MTAVLDTAAVSTSCRVVDLTELSTPELVARAQAGEMDAFDPLYRRYADRVMGYAVIKLDGDRAGAEDLAADTWALAMESIHQFRPGAGVFSGWLIGITRHQIYRRYGEKWMEFPVGAMSSDVDDACSLEVTAAVARYAVGECPTEDRVGEVTRAHLRDLVREAIESLPPMQREVAQLSMAGLRYCDIVRATGRTFRSVYGAYFKLCVNLRRRLAPYGAIADTRSRRSAAPAPNRLAELLAAAESLSPSQREVVLLRLKGYRQCEVMQMTGRSKISVQGAWAKGRAALRRAGLSV